VEKKKSEESRLVEEKPMEKQETRLVEKKLMA
jgi:hypothetical protein